MQGVTTAIVAFIFAGIIWPHLVKNKVQFYAALLMVAVIILFDSLAHIFGNLGDPDGPNGFAQVAYAITGLLQIAAITVLVLSTGLSARELGGEMFNTIDVVRRGGEKETIIVPLTGEKPKPRNRDAGGGGGGGAPAAIRLDPARDIAAEEAALDAAEAARAAAAVKEATPAAPAAVVRKPEAGSIPLDPLE